MADWQYTYDNWGVPGYGMIAAVYNGDSDKYYFFYSDGTYYRKELGQSPDGPYSVEDEWGFSVAY